MREIERAFYRALARKIYRASYGRGFRRGFRLYRIYWWLSASAFPAPWEFSTIIQEWQEYEKYFLGFPNCGKWK